MADRASGFALQLIYLFTHLTLVNVADIALVAGLLFVVLQALYHTRAQQLLRGASTFAILGLVLLLLLPSSTFHWLLRSLLVAGAVALPLLAQVEKGPRQVLVSPRLLGHDPGLYLLPLEVQAPEALRVELFPAEVDIALAEERPEALPQEVR